jgi:NhaP-type Na+/H+ or K+/H+ antiporter
VNETLVVVIAALLLVWSVFSGVLARHNVTGPLLFTVAGYVAANPSWGPLQVNLEAADVHTLAEITLALVLFSDASRVNLGTLRHDIGVPLRLLGVGLPLTLVIGGLGALVMFNDLPWSLALFVGAALAPTDAALSAQVINDRRVPMRLREALNVESGLNDGIATPFVTLALALALPALGLDAESEAYVAGTALRELGLGVVAGAAIGLIGAGGIRLASRHHLTLPGGRRLAALATALTAFELAVAVDGNGFIAAFIAGIAFGAMLGSEEAVAEHMVELPELGGEVLALVVWFLAGASLVPVAFDHLGASLLGYALLSLTAFRMLPVAVSMVRSGLSGQDVVFVGWFGPRGLASVVFALLAIEVLGEGEPTSQEAIAAVAMTVLLSVLLHGVTAGPGGNRYSTEGAAATSDDDATQPLARPSHVLAE